MGGLRPDEGLQLVEGALQHRGWWEEHHPEVLGARRLAEAARARVEREFSSDATARNVMLVYDEVLAEARGGDGG